MALVCVSLFIESKYKRPCPLAERGAYIDGVRKAVEYKLGALYLLDEYEFAGTCDACRAQYRKLYAMEMPGKMDFSKLAQPSYYNFIIFKMNVINELIHDMVETAKKERPEIMCFHVTSPNNHFRLIGYHDLETQSDYLTTTCSDLYSVDLDFVKYMLKHIRGAQGNDRPVMTVNGCMYNSRNVFINARLHLLAGSNGMWYFSLGFMRTYPQLSEIRLGSLSIDLKGWNQLWYYGESNHEPRD